MTVLEAGQRGWFPQCLALLQAGQSIELRIRGWRARRFARAVALGSRYRPNIMTLWMMPRLNAVLEAAAQGRYQLTARETGKTDELSFLFTVSG